MSSIPEAYHDLLVERPAYTALTTMNPNGLPHQTLVWVDYDADRDRVLVNTERGRRKERNVDADPRVGALVIDPDSWYRWVSVAGEVDRVRTEGARDHIDALARRYMGVEEYPNPVETERVVLEIAPEDVITFDQT